MSKWWLFINGLTGKTEGYGLTEIVETRGRGGGGGGGGWLTKIGKTEGCDLSEQLGERRSSIVSMEEL